MIENPSIEKIILNNIVKELDYLITFLAEKDLKKDIPFYIQLQELIRDQEAKL